MRFRSLRLPAQALRSLSENRDFVQNREILINKHSHMFDIASIIFLGIPKSLGKSPFSDSLLGKINWDNIPAGDHILVPGDNPCLPILRNYYA